MMNFFSILWQTPWKVLNECFRVITLPICWIDMMLSQVKIETGWKFYGRPIWQIHRGSQIQFGKRIELRSSVRSNPLAPFHPCLISTRTDQAQISIGDGFGMTGGSIVAAEKITIGDRVLLGANSIIIDTDFHPLDAQKRKKTPLNGVTAAVSIGDDVFIGTQVMILKGSQIGNGAVIGAGSVVTGKIPARTVAAGNPAKVIKKL